MNPIQQFVKCFLPGRKKEKSAPTFDEVYEVKEVVSDALCSMDAHIHDMMNESLRLGGTSSLLMVGLHGIQYVYVEVALDKIHGVSVVVVCRKGGEFDQACLEWSQAIVDTLQGKSGSHLKVNTHNIRGMFPTMREVDEVTYRSNNTGTLIRKPSGIITWSFTCDQVLPKSR